ncbi:ribosome biogenesis GTP-binding protein YihA/YsxC [Emcibacter sp.]|uniref:ribosome biogenesis GTP-binding protein YihA/YsxC n=1 Tax=Emcibacter sp. TaxID=1979954 RepID=UPI002AA6C902|nr:ribosome biogenesis GTP-binding protein YihA/YsxC [Emcibacter sp.]
MTEEMTEQEKAVWLERGRLLFTQSCDFIMGSPVLENLPPADYAEIAFAGRSNVGKSSLINGLTGRKTLARTSNTPGRTQMLNFFLLGKATDLALYLVDLPGYGYAKVSRSLVKEWTKLMKDYLRGRPNLRRVYVLVDSRHGIKEGDRDIMKLMDESAVSYQIILTKVDKLKKGEQEKVREETENAIKKNVAAYPQVILTSSVKGDGLDELRASIAVLAAS